MRLMKVSVIDVPGEDFLRRVADIKNAHPFLALGDCYAIGLADWLNSEVVTANRIFERASGFSRVKRIR